MKMKKGTDVLEIFDGQSGENFLIKARSKDGIALLRALEKLIGSPALDDYGDTGKGYNHLAIGRYRLSEDIKLSKPD